VEPEPGARQTDHGAGIAAGWAPLARQALSEVGAKEGAQARRAPTKAITPAARGGTRQPAAAFAAPNASPRRANRLAANEDPIEDLSRHIHGVVRSGLLKGRQRGERRVREAPAFVSLDGDVRRDGVEKDEAPEVMSVLREAAVRAAPRARIRTWKFQTSPGAEAPGQLPIGLERAATKAVLCHSTLGALGW
jgi:hypothetical protein